MVRIETGISLLSASDGTEVYGVNNHGNSETFILTSSRTIAVFRVSDSKPLHSWMTKPSSCFSCPAVYRQNNDEFVAIVNRKQIYKWSSETADPFKQKPTTLKSPVSRILCASADHLLLLMSNGALRWLDDALMLPKAMKEGCLRTGEEIIDAWVWGKGHGVHGGEKESTSFRVICLVQDPQGKGKRVVVLSIKRKGDEMDDDTRDDITRLNLDSPRSKENLDLVSASCFCHGPTATLFTLWQGGSLCCTTISEADLRGGRETQTVACHLKCAILGNEDELRIAAIDNRHVAIAGVQKVTDKDASQASITVWETTYGTVQARHALSLEGDDSVPSYFGEVKGHLLLATNKTVMLHRYECSVGTLASALGRLADAEEDQELPVLVCGVDWSNQEKSTGTKSRGKKAKPTTETSQTISSASELLHQIFDQTKTNTSQKFSAAVKKFLKSFDQSLPDSTALTLILKNTVKRVEENSRFWSEEALRDIISTKVIAASSCPEFVAMLARRQELPLMVDCLSFMKDIPELTLIQCLQVFLSIDEAKLPSSDPSDEVPMEEELPSTSNKDVMSKARRTYVDQVLVKPFTDSFLLDAVKHFQFQEVLLLLKHLHLLLTTNHLEEAESPVTMDTVVDWTGILLDAHFSQLVLLPEVRPLLAKLHEAVKQQVDFSTELNTIQNLLNYASKPNSKSYTRRVYSAKSYTIEVLKVCPC